MATTTPTGGTHQISFAAVHTTCGSHTTRRNSTLPPSVLSPQKMTCFRGPSQSAACTSPVLLFYLPIAYIYDITHSRSNKFFQELIVDALLHKNTTSYTRLTFIIIEYHVRASFDRTRTHVGTNQKKVNVLLKYTG